MRAKNYKMFKNKETAIHWIIFVDSVITFIVLCVIIFVIRGSENLFSFLEVLAIAESYYLVLFLSLQVYRYGSAIQLYPNGIKAIGRAILGTSKRFVLWENMASVTFKDYHVLKYLIINDTKDTNIAIQLDLHELDEFIRQVVRYAGDDHPLSIALKKYKSIEI